MKLDKWDLELLARAVAMQESGINGRVCSSYVAKKYKNCHGLTNYIAGGFIKFNSYDESYVEFKRLWSTSSYYGGMPTLSKAIKYSGGDNSQAWLNNVLFYMNNN